MILSSGGSRGAFQVGVMEYLMEHHDIEWITGTSVGAINGGILASGTGIDDLEDTWKSLHRHDIFPVKPNFRTFSNQETLRSIIDPLMRTQDISETKIPLTINAKNMMTKQEHLFHEGSLVDSALASSAIPKVFPPVVIDDTPFHDFGVFSHHVRKEPQAIVLVDLMNPRSYSRHPFSYLIGKRYEHLRRQRLRELMDKHLVIDVALNVDIPMYEFRHTKKLIAHGYRMAERNGL